LAFSVETSITRLAWRVLVFLIVAMLPGVVALFAGAENLPNRIYEQPEGFRVPYSPTLFGVKAKFRVR